MTESDAPAVVDDDAPEEFNPPKDWAPPPPPTVDDEDELLAEAFGEPNDDGVYAPYIPAVTE